MPKKTKQIIPAKKAQKTDKDYHALLDELKSIITQGQFKAYKTVDNIKVQTYWQLGERVVREELKHKNRAEYGQYLVTNLSRDLQIRRQELYKIVKFYRFYDNVGSVTRQLSWTHYYYLIDINENEKRTFYENKVIINSWSVRELRRQIRNRLYENTPKKEIQAVFHTKLPAVRPQEIFKDTYNFQFIELKGGVKF